MNLERFREIVALDTEFKVRPGERPVPVCFVARELKSGRVFRIFEGEFGTRPPYATGDDVLVVAYFASAELGCYRALDWPMPTRILDLFVEFRNLTNGLPTVAGSGLLGALTHFGLDGIDATDKKALQEAIGTGTWPGLYTRDEILDYCQSDVDALARLLPRMWPMIDLPRALLRGRYMAGVSAMEHSGVPIDTPTLARLRGGWFDIQDKLIADIDSQYHVFDGRTFKTDYFAQYLIARNIPWPRLESGALDLGDDTFREMAKSHPIISPLRELRHSLSRLRLNDLAVGGDGRNRTLISPFRARTGRNQPSNSKFIFGPSVWLRGLIKPPPGYGLAYIDWSQQEFGIAAARSGDTRMMEAYLSGDCYLAFGKQCGLIPPDGTKETHEGERDLCKQCILGVQYGMAEYTLALRIGQPVIVARDLLRLHRETYSTFWRWSDAALDIAMTTNQLQTEFGWTIYVGEDSNPRSLRNFPCQGNGAEMMRIAVCLATERGVEVVAPVHDALLVCAPLDRLDHDIVRTQQAMVEASRAVLDGFEIRTDVKTTKYPDRFMDEKRGRKMWEHVMNNLLGRHDDSTMRATA